MNRVIRSLKIKPISIETAAFDPSGFISKLNFAHHGIKRKSSRFLLMLVLSCFFGYNNLMAQVTPPFKFEVDGNLRATQKLFVGIPITVTEDQKITDLLSKAEYLNYSLYVNGTAMITKLVVKKYEAWPDYVFDSSYNLMPLPDLQAYIARNKHLPSIPAAAEVEKEGVDVARTQAALLHKIEELTLYILQQEKEINLQKKASNELQVRLEHLEKAVKLLLDNK